MGAGVNLAPMVATWPVGRSAYAVVTSAGPVEQSGDTGTFELASITKVFAGLAAMIAVEEESIDLDEHAGPEGSTVRHLLAHASGLDFDSDRIVAGVGVRRVYSNTGIELFADHLERRTGLSYRAYVEAGILEPLGMMNTELTGSPAHGMRSTVGDLVRLAFEFLAPTLVSPDSLRVARTPVFPDLAGALPGIGRFDPNPFGLAVEVKGAKRPHWSGSLTSSETFGHFGGTGTFLWIDPVIEVAAIGLTDRTFGPWAMEVWPRFGDAVVEAVG